MVMTDPVADMLTRIRNANVVYKEKVDIPASKTKLGIARILKEEGYIQDFELKGEEQKIIEIMMKYEPSRNRVISGLKRVSRPGLRVYTNASNVPRVLGGFGIAILSTPRGIMTNKKAKKEGVGGEVLCHVW